LKRKYTVIIFRNNIYINNKNYILYTYIYKIYIYIIIYSIEGICIVKNEENLCDIQAIIKGPEGTPYEGGAFQIKLVLGSDFPISPPKGLVIYLFIYYYY